MDDVLDTDGVAACIDFKHDLDSFFVYYMPLIIIVGLIGKPSLERHARTGHFCARECF